MLASVAVIATDVADLLEKWTLKRVRWLSGSQEEPRSRANFNHSLAIHTEMSIR